MALTRILLRHASAVTLAATLALSAGGATVFAADPSTTIGPGAAAAGWIAVKVKAGVGPGSLADAIFAYAATGTGSDAAAFALTRLESGVDGYILAVGGGLVPGNLAKTLLAVQVAGGNPAVFGGHNLETDLRGLLIATPGPDLGRFGTAGNLDQALAILALARTNGGVPAKAVDWLVAAQCPNGDYQWDGTCPGSGAEDPDTTAVVLQALLASGATTAAATSTQLLLHIQGSDGSFSSYGTANTNSTGVAGEALRAAGQTAAADAAAAFVLTLRYGCDARAADRGAFRWAASNAGLLIFSTPQAVLALGAPALDHLRITGASVAAPILDCPVAAPTGPAPTLPPTDLRAGAPGTGGGSSLLIGLLLLVASAGGAAVTARLRVRR